MDVDALPAAPPVSDAVVTMPEASTAAATPPSGGVEQTVASPEGAGPEASVCEPSYLRDVFGINPNLQGRTPWDPKEMYAAIARHGETRAVEALLTEFDILKGALLDRKFASPYEHAMAVWNVTDPQQFMDPDVVDQTTTELKGRVFEIMLTMENYKLYQNELFQSRGMTETAMNSILTLTHYLGNIVTCAAHCQSLYQGKMDYTLKTETPLLRFGCTEGVYGSLKTPYQCLLYKMMWDLKENGRVRYKGAVRKKKFTPEGHFTRAFVHEMDLDEWVYKFGAQHTDFERWKLLTSGRTNARDAARYLSECYETLMFPEIKKTRTLFAFTNGLYDARTTTFMPYDSEACKCLPESTIAAKYFELPFDDEPYASYLDIPTPHFDKILTAQEFEPEVADWLLAFMGRSVFDGDDLDSWQVCMFLKGLGGR